MSLPSLSVSLELESDRLKEKTNNQFFVCYFFVALIKVSVDEKQIVLDSLMKKTIVPAVCQDRKAKALEPGAVFRIFFFLLGASDPIKSKFFCPTPDPITEPHPGLLFF
jgi:hypothetical protein